MKRLLHCKSHSQRGLSLIECLAYIGVLSVLMAIGGSTVAKAWDRSRALSRNSQDIQRALNVGERWRADIRAATGRIETIATPTNQTLRIPMQGGRVDYEFTEGEIRRRASEQTVWMTVLPKVNASQMQPGTEPGVTSWQWELELKPAQKKTHMRPLFTFTAVSGSGTGVSPVSSCPSETHEQFDAACDHDALIRPSSFVIPSSFAVSPVRTATHGRDARATSP